MIFGIAGKLESGKDTVADYLTDKYKFKKLAFADNLKHMCMNVFGLTLEQCYTTEGKLKRFEKQMQFTREHAIKIISWLNYKNDWLLIGRNEKDIIDVTYRDIRFNSARHVLQFVGTEVLRDCVDPDIHAKVLFNQINEHNFGNVAICDARFVNERNIVRENGGKLILVDCVQTREQESTHRSETGLGDKGEYHHVIINDKDKGFDYLYSLVDAMMGTI